MFNYLYLFTVYPLEYIHFLVNKILINDKCIKTACWNLLWNKILPNTDSTNFLWNPDFNKTNLIKLCIIWHLICVSFVKVLILDKVITWFVHVLAKYKSRIIIIKMKKQNIALKNKKYIYLIIWFFFFALPTWM